jgi:hypothetical protein
MNWNRTTIRILLPAATMAAVLSALTLWWLVGASVNAQSAKEATDTPPVIAPPRGTSIWAVDKSTVYLDLVADKRKFFLVEPDAELASQGARSGSLLFEGRAIEGKTYEGKLLFFAGRCGTREYEASGPITNGGQTVTLTGTAPQIDPESCLKTGEREETLVFNFQRVAK